MQAFILARAIENHLKNKRLAEAFEAIVSAYYAEYEDADELDYETGMALFHLFDICFPTGETDDGKTFEDLIKKGA